MDLSDFSFQIGPETPPLIQHLERYLGRIQRGWAMPLEHGKPHFQVVHFVGPVLDANCVVTVGLSNYLLHSPTAGRPIRSELVMVLPRQFDRAAALLKQVGDELVQSGHVLLRGDVVGPRGPLFADCDKTALYATAPTFTEDSFAVCEIEGVGPIVLIWLVPIATSEAQLAASGGWRLFEDLLEAQSADVVDIDRNAVV